jgi:hypothetical protein
MSLTVKNFNEGIRPNAFPKRKDIPKLKRILMSAGRQKTLRKPYLSNSK